MNNGIQFSFVDSSGFKPEDGNKVYVQLTGLDETIDIVNGKDVQKMLKDLKLVQEDITGLNNMFAFSDPFDQVKVSLQKLGFKYVS